MITELPAVTPVRIPVAEPIVALLLLDIQVPPDVPSDNVSVPPPAHKVPIPVMAVGNGFIVSIVVAIQPVAVTLKVIVVVPAVTPVTTPDVVPIVATEVVLLLHVPPAPSVRFVVAPTHRLEAPLITPGNALIVWFAVIKHPVDANL